MVDAHCLWCKKPMSTESWQEGHIVVCSDECKDALNSYEDRKGKRIEARLTPTYKYRKFDDAAKELWQAITGEENTPNLGYIFETDHLESTTISKFVYELRDDQLASMHNEAVWLLAVLDDLPEIIDKAKETKKKESEA